MADFEKVYSIGFNATKALRSLTAFEKRFAKLDKRILKFSESFEKFGTNATRGQRGINSALEKMDQLLGKVDRETKKVSKSVSKFMKPIGGASRGMEDLGRRGARATRNIQRGAINASRGIRRIGVASKSASGSIAGLITKIGLFIGAAQGIRSVVSNFLDFDRSMTLAGAKFSSLDKDMAPGTEAFKQFRKEIREAAVDTEHTSAAVAGAVDFWAKAGKTAAQTKAVIPVTLDFASANTDASGAALDMARAGDILSDALGQFQLDSADPTTLMSNTARVADVMSKAANSANVSAEELFESYKTAGPVLTAVGGDIEETSALLATMANAGIKGSIAGRQLKIAVSALNAPSAKQSKLLEKYNVQVKDAEGNMNTLTDVIGQLDTATRDLGTGERFEVFATLLGREGVTGFLNLVAKGEADIAGLSKRLRQASGETARLAEITRKSASAQMKRFWNQLSNVGFTIIEETQLFDKLGKALNSIDWKVVSDFITNRFIPAITGIARVISNYVLPVIGVLTGALGKVLGPAIDVITGRFDSLNDGGEEFAGTLDNVIEKTGQVTGEWIKRIAVEFSAFAEMFRNSILNMEELYAGFMSGMARDGYETYGHLTALGDTLLSSYNDVFQELKALFLEVVSVFLGGADDIEEDWFQTGNKMSSDFADAVAFISATIGTIVQTAAAVFSAVIRVVTVVVSGIRSSFENLFGGILDIAEGDFLRGFARVGIAIADAITLPVRAAFAGLLKLVSKIPGADELAKSFGIDLDYMGDAVKDGFGGLMADEEKSINRSGSVDNRPTDFVPFEAPSFEQPMQSLMPSIDVPDMLSQQSIGTELQNELNRLNENINTLAPSQPDMPISPLIAEQLKLQEKASVKTEAFQQKILEATQQHMKSKPSDVNVTVEGSSFTINAEGADAQEVGRIVRREMAAGERRQRDNVRSAVRGVTFGEQ